MRARRALPNLEARFRTEGLGDFLVLFPPRLLNRIAALNLPLCESQNPALLERSAGSSTVTVYDVLDRLDILDHTLELYRSVRLFRSARERQNEFRGRGNPDLVNEEGLLPALSIIFEFSAVLNSLCSNPAVEAALCAGIFLHDLGKFIRQAYHFENSFLMIRNHAPLRAILTKAFSPEQMEIIENAARYHSLYSDLVVLREADILRPYAIVLSSSPLKEKQLQMNDLLYVMSVLDTDAYFPGESRLSPDRLQAYQKLHADLRRAVLQGKTLEVIQARAAEIHRQWGKDRFDLWVIGNTDIKTGKDAEARTQAEEELVRLLPSVEERKRFFEVLGGLQHVGLIFDLRKELENPLQRTRLAIWLYRHAAVSGEKLYEFRINREKGKWVGPQVEILRRALSGNFDLIRINSVLSPAKRPDGIVEIIIGET